MRSDKALRNAFRRLQLPTSGDPRNIVAALMPAIPAEVGNVWDGLEGDDEARVTFAFQHPALAHLLTVGITLPTFREELEWILARFDEGLPEGDVIDLGSGAGVTAAVLALATKRIVTACEPVTGATSATAHVADTVGVEVRPIEAPLSKLTPDAFDGARVGIAQSILSYVGFGFESENLETQAERSALVRALESIGEALKMFR